MVSMFRTVVLAERFPAASNASTEREWVVSHSSPVMVYVRLVVVPAFASAFQTPYPATPTLSLEAPHESEIDVVVEPVLETDGGAVGAVVSEQPLVDAVAVVRAERLPAASAASTPNAYVVPHVRPETVAVVPVTVATRSPFR